ncbi:MAG: MerR family transcriptional regulator, partial [Thermoanaerobaculales bacterium]|nr:MerR family transcriptional regulator [Thermoanaerobaculales bacterium]
MTEKVVLPGDQEFFKLNEVCKLANVQPYMLRFWGTEFEQLETTTTDTGQRLYSRPQMGLILEIRRLLFDEGLTIAGARKEIDRLVGSGRLDLGGAP